MRRADRLFDIIQILRTAKRPVTAAALAEKLECTPRTIYRDIATLQARRVPIDGEAGVGYALDDTAWGQGYATEAMRALLQWAWDTLPLNRLQAEIDTRNTASARVLEKLGFRLEGTLREDCIVDGEVSDSGVYGLLRREWR